MNPHEANAGSGASIALKLILKYLLSPIVISKSVQNYFGVEWPFKQTTVVASSKDLLGVAEGVGAVAIDESSNLECNIQGLKAYKAKVICIDGSLKSLAVLAKTLGINYVATASISDYNDMIRKIRTAVDSKSSFFIQVLAPDPLEWGYPAKNTVRIAKLAVETGVFLLLDTQGGKLMKKEAVKPVEEFLNAQEKFKTWPLQS